MSYISRQTYWKGLIIFFFFYFYEVDPLIEEAFYLVCQKKLSQDGYCDMSEYIYGRIIKDDMLANLQKIKSPFTSLYRKPYPKYEHVNEAWYNFSTKNSLNFKDNITLSLIEAKAIVNWIYHAYQTPLERENATIDILPAFRNKLDIGELRFSKGIIYNHDKINVCFINSFEKFILEIQDLNSSGHSLFYRGHSNTNYKLLPSIMRKKSWLEHECDLYNETIIECPDAFQKCVTHLDFLVEMQHYGLPTRLLDVTKNPLVALYFACVDDNNSHGEFIVFDVEKEKVKYPKSDTVSILSSLPLLKNNLKNHFRTLAIDKTISELSFNQKVDRLLHEVKLEKPAFKNEIKKEDITSCFFVQAEKKNARIIKQDGAFIICGLFSEKDTTINQFRYKEHGKIQLYIIEKKAKDKIIEQLDKMSINRAQLFPEIQDVTTHIKNKY